LFFIFKLNVKEVRKRLKTGKYKTNKFDSRTNKKK